jgi:hypothetical protein
LTAAPHPRARHLSSDDAFRASDHRDIDGLPLDLLIKRR